MSLKGKRNSSA